MCSLFSLCFQEVLGSPCVPRSGRHSFLSEHAFSPHGSQSLLVLFMVYVKIFLRVPQKSETYNSISAGFWVHSTHRDGGFFSLLLSPIFKEPSLSHTGSVDFTNFPPGA